MLPVRILAGGISGAFAAAGAMVVVARLVMPEPTDHEPYIIAAMIRGLLVTGGLVGALTCLLARGGPLLAGLPAAAAFVVIAILCQMGHATGEETLLILGMCAGPILLAAGLAFGIASWTRGTFRLPEVPGPT